MKTAKTLTHDERLALIRRPFPTVRQYGGRRWGGVNIRDAQELFKPSNNRQQHGWNADIEFSVEEWEGD